VSERGRDPGMIAAVTARAFDAATELAPVGVDVRRLPDGRDHAAFVLPDWQDRETIEALPQLERLRVVQALSAGTDWIEARVPAWATLCNARGARDASVAEWVVGAYWATPTASSPRPVPGAGRTPRRASCTARRC
jgi:phosphoglycerate dehydrogenase-like enzyme